MSTTHHSTQPSERRSRRALLALSIASLGLVGAICLLAFEVQRLRVGSRPSSADVIAHLVTAQQGGWDTHTDADVGRVLQPGLKGELGTHSNIFGLREREFAVPKPAGTVRVVLLGDSFVQGYGVREEERLGTHLERWLNEHAQARPARLEVLHVGIGSWNLRAECAFLRRALSLLAPDLVVHVIVENDIDDTPDARGFGAMATFSSQVRERANGLTNTGLPMLLGGRFPGFLPYGLDYESRARFDAGRAAIEDLQARLRARGTEYVLLLHWVAAPMVAQERLARGFPARNLLYVPGRFSSDPHLRVSDDDTHWSAEAHRLVAGMLYGAIQERQLLPGLDLRAVPEHASTFHELQSEGAGHAHAEVPAETMDLILGSLAPRLALPIGPETPLQQVYAGLDRRGNVSPYFAAILAPRGGTKLKLRARGLQRQELAGATVEIRADEAQLGSADLRSGGDFEVELAIPPELRSRPVLAIRLIASDYVYLRDLRTTVSFVLEELSIVP